MNCPNPKCKESDHAADAKYCHQCGSRLRNRNLLRWCIGVVVVVIVGVFVYFSITSYREAVYKAQNAGRISAEKYNKCQQRFIYDLQIEVNQFIAEFNNGIPEKYETREEAEQELNAKIHIRKIIYDKEYAKAERYKKEQCEKYGNSYLTQKKFAESFANVLNESFDIEKTIEEVYNSEEIKSCLYKLLPKKPNEAQVCQDLVGHKLKGAADNPFFNASWHFTINSNDCVEEVKVISSSCKNDKWNYLLDIIVKEGGHRLLVRAEIIYELNYLREKWQLVDIISQDVAIVKTETYRNAVSVQYIETDYYTSVEIMNKNESPLLVGIEVWKEEEREWLSQKITLGTDEKRTIRCSGKDRSCFFRIVFVEKA